MAAEAPLVRIVAEWDCAELLRQTPGSLGIWDSIRFAAEPVAECDYLFMLNNRRLEPLTVQCPRAHVWCVMEEPYIPGLHDWMIEDLEAYARVFTHYPPSSDPKYVRSYPLLPWAVGRSYDDLCNAKVPQKERAVSWITSNLGLLPGHRNRNALRAFIGQKRPGAVDIYGRGVRYVEKKWDALAPYRYSLAIENSRSKDYWTEKIADCFLSWTLPLYDGCPNLEDYFPPDSFVRIDANDRAGTLRRIEELSRSDEWERRMPAIGEARRRVLEEYQMFPALARAIRNYGSAARERATIRIPGFREVRWKYRWRYITRALHEGRAADPLRLIAMRLHYMRWLRIEAARRVNVVSPRTVEAQRRTD